VSRKISVLSLIATLFLVLFSSADAASYGYDAHLKMALATRTGPGTWYDEPGTFFGSNYRDTSVRVLSKAWDDRNSIWWLQVEFYRNSTCYRAYTGLKRVDIDINDVPEEKVLGTAVTQRSAAGYWGPGTDYAASQYDIPSGISVTVLDVENNYAQIEFYDGRTADRSYARRRAWIKVDYLDGSWSTAHYSKDWEYAYRSFISTEEYKKYLRVENPEYSDMFYERNTEWDSMSSYDFDQDSVPELLIRSDYSIEQIDVFSYRNGSVRWVGTMGGNNFFQTILSYDRAGFNGRLYTFSGGPAMEINEYKVIHKELIKLPIGRSQVNSNGDETIGVSMFVSDYNLEQLIHGTLFINGNDQGEHLRWFSRNSLSSESNWNDLFSTPRGYGSWN
jgi:hypothetical protein